MERALLEISEECRVADAELLEVRTPGHGRVHVRALVKADGRQVREVVLASRVKSADRRFALPFECRESNGAGKVEVSVDFDPMQMHLEGALWDLEIVMTGDDDDVAFCQVKISKDFRRWAKIRNIQCDAGNGFVFFPYTAASSRLAFAYRPKSKADTVGFRMKELAAVALAKLGKPYWKRKRIWLVFEKYCAFAQDNGFAFFKYCMEDIPETERKGIYFVMDPSSPDYKNVEPYRGNVIDFLSFKHLLYALVASMYVGSDSTAHLYQWRPKPSLVWSRIRKHKIFFLQHGVTALKDVSNLFGVNGANPMTYFLTTSKREQEIVVERLGYDEAHAPILGFSRWDLLEDKSDADHPVILVMPTWRPWLEELSDEAFKESDYFAAWSGLCANEELIDLLEQQHATLRFYIHPKLSEQLAAFGSDRDAVQFIDAGSQPLNELIMECSMLVTDYSSVCWDVLYMGKPAVFYQFDRARYTDEVGSLIDLETELPGLAAVEEHGVVAAVSSTIEARFAVPVMDNSAARAMMATPCGSTREATYRFLLKTGC